MTTLTDAQTIDVLDRLGARAFRALPDDAPPLRRPSPSPGTGPGTRPMGTGDGTKDLAPPAVVVPIGPAPSGTGRRRRGLEWGRLTVAAAAVVVALVAVAVLRPGDQSVSTGPADGGPPPTGPNGFPVLPEGDPVTVPDLIGLDLPAAFEAVAATGAGFTASMVTDETGQAAQVVTSVSMPAPGAAEITTFDHVAFEYPYPNATVIVDPARPGLVAFVRAHRDVFAGISINADGNVVEISVRPDADYTSVAAGLAEAAGLVAGTGDNGPPTVLTVTRCLVTPAVLDEISAGFAAGDYPGVPAGLIDPVVDPGACRIRSADPGQVLDSLPGGRNEFHRLTDGGVYLSAPFAVSEFVGDR